MFAARKNTHKKDLHDFVPLNALSEAHFDEISHKIIIEEIKTGDYLFRRGERDNQSVYLLDGTVSLLDGKHNAVSEIEAGSDASYYPLANENPRIFTARAETKLTIARIDSGLLDVLLTRTGSSDDEAMDIHADENEDWMTSILKTRAFVKIPPVHIQRLLMKMWPLPVKAGEVIIRQGDVGENFYTIHKGRSAITRSRLQGSEDELLAELSEGDSFGEEALVSDEECNATVTMLTDGLLICLAKDDFIKLMQASLVRHVTRTEATSMAHKGAILIDVRTAEEFARKHVDDSINMPIASFRNDITGLAFTNQYILCSGHDRRSISVAFILSHRGFDVYVLDGGIEGFPADELVVDDVAEAPAGTGAEVIPLNQADVKVVPDAVVPAMPADSATVPVERYDDLKQRFVDICARLDSLNEKYSVLGKQHDELHGRAEAGAQSDVVVEQQVAEIEALQHQLVVSQQALTAAEASVNAEVERSLALEKDRSEQEASHRANAERLDAELQAATGNLHELSAELNTVRESGQRFEEQAQSDQVVLKEQVVHLEAGAEDALRQALKAQKKFDEVSSKHEAQQRAVEKAATEKAQQVDDLNQTLASSSREIAELKEQSNQAKAQYEQVERESSQAVSTYKKAAKSVEKALEGAQKDALKAADMAASDMEKKRQLVEDMRQKLADARREINHLQKNSTSQSDMAHKAQQKIQADLEERLAATRQLQESLDEALAVKQTLESQAAESLQESQRDKEQAQRELDALQAKADALESEIAGHVQQQEDQSRQYKAGQEEQASQVKAFESANAALKVEQQSARTLQTEKDAAVEAIEALEQKNHGLEADQQQLETRLQESARQVQDINTAREAALHKQQDKWAHEQEKLKKELSEQLAAGRSERDSLAAGLETAADEKCQLEEQHKAANERNHQDLEQQAVRLAEAQENSQRLSDELQMMENDKDKLQESLDTSRQDAGKLQREKEKLDSQINSMSGALDEEIETLQDRLTAEEEERIKSDREVLTRDQQIASIEDELESRVKEQQAADQKAAELATRLDAMRIETETLEQERREQEQEAGSELDKLQADVQQKNAAEKALQSQIDELHRKLVQSTDDLQAARDQAREEVSTSREVLSEERAAYETDRNEMMLHQQQLTQQLGEMTSRHEEYKSSQDVSLQEAVDDVHRNEQEQIGVLQNEQATLEKQVEALKSDLDKVRAESAALVTEEQQRFEADLALVREQKTGAETARLQLEERLKQITDERDAAVKQQQGAHDKLKSLRAEAEQERDKARRETEGLLDQLKHNNRDTRTDTSSVPVLKKVVGKQDADTGTAVARAQHIPATEKPVAVPPEIAGTETAEVQPLSSLLDQVVDTGSGNKYRWLGASIGLVMVVAVAMLLWVLLQPADPVMSTVAESVPEASEVVAEVVVKKQQKKAAPVTAAPVNKPESEPRLVALGTFTDALKSGRRGPKMVKLPAATFMMGSVGNSNNFDEGPRHKVRVPKFSISKHEITFSDYDRFARATGRRLPYDQGWGRGKRPVVNVNWGDAAAYAKWISRQTGKDYRLPSEAQWEFAARAGSEGAYWWGGKTAQGKSSCFDCGSEWDNQSTAKVGSFAANAFGLHDTSGNVQEWINDCYYRGYKGAPTDGSARVTPECSQRVVRGGSYTSPQDSLRTTRRGQTHQDTRLDNLGFRIVRLNQGSAD